MVLFRARAAFLTSWFSASVVFITSISAIEILVPADQPTIQAAVTVANNGDTVIVAPGVYVENVDLLGKAITVRSSMGPESTVIDGSSLTLGPDFGSVLTFNDGEQDDTLVEGFTLTGGTGDVFLGFLLGGGIFCLNSSPTFQELVIEVNTAYSGGGVYLEGSRANFTSCTIRENTAIQVGGLGGVGAGLVFVQSTPMLTDCFITLNTIPNSTGLGGGGLFAVASEATLTRCEISENTVMPIPSSGGAIEAIDSPLTLVDCVIARNLCFNFPVSLSSGNDGTSYLSGCSVIDNIGLNGNIRAAIVQFKGDAVIERCLIANNQGDGFEHQYSNAEPTLSIDRCTFAYNDGRGFHERCQLVICDAQYSITNSIFWQNGEEQLDISPPENVTYCDVEGSFPGVGNIDADPLFADPDNGVFSLALGSPCINAGDPSSTPDEDGSLADMGAFPTLSSFRFRRGDANGDGVFNGIADGLFVLGFQFIPGSPAPPCKDAADVDDDGVISGLLDGLLILNYQFLPGSTPPAPPGPVVCGPDPTSDPLDCDEATCS